MWSCDDESWWYLQEYAEEGREMLDIIKTSRWQYLLIAIIASYAEGTLFCLLSFSFLISGIQVRIMASYCVNAYCTLCSHSLIQAELRKMHAHCLCGLLLFLLAWEQQFSQRVTVLAVMVEYWYLSWGGCHCKPCYDRLSSCSHDCHVTYFACIGNWMVWFEVQLDWSSCLKTGHWCFTDSKC